MTLRQVLDLYACIRPVRYFEGVGAPVKEPGKLDVGLQRRQHGRHERGGDERAGAVMHCDELDAIAERGKPCGDRLLTGLPARDDRHDLG